MRSDPKSLTQSYLDAVGKKEFKKLEELLAPNLEFNGPAMSRSSAKEYLEALKRLGVIHVRNDVKRLFVDGDEVCVIYDFVTDTPAGAARVYQGPGVLDRVPRPVNTRSRVSRASEMIGGHEASCR